jgi:hypothetical protein
MPGRTPQTQRRWSVFALAAGAIGIAIGFILVAVGHPGGWNNVVWGTLAAGLGMLRLRRLARRPCKPNRSPHD